MASESLDVPLEGSIADMPFHAFVPQHFEKEGKGGEVLSGSKSMIDVRR